MSLPSHREKLISQIPALQVLMHLGYEYLTPAEALALRGGSGAPTRLLSVWLSNLVLNPPYALLSVLLLGLAPLSQE